MGGSWVSILSSGQSIGLDPDGISLSSVPSPGRISSSSAPFGGSSTDPDFLRNREGKENDPLPHNRELVGETLSSSFLGVLFSILASGVGTERPSGCGDGVKDCPSGRGSREGRWDRLGFSLLTWTTFSVAATSEHSCSPRLCEQILKRLLTTRYVRKGRRVERRSDGEVPCCDGVGRVMSAGHQSIESGMKGGFAKESNTGNLSVNTS